MNAGVSFEKEKVKESQSRSVMMSLKVIHFQSIFLIDFYLRKTDLCAECGITHQTAMQQEIQKKEYIAVEGAEGG